MNEKKYKKVLLIDLDGVLNTYTGNFDKDFIPPIRKGAKEFLESLSDEFEVKLFTTRNRLLASKWLIENRLDKIVTDITNNKELCHLFIDDRCLEFHGNYNELFNDIKTFKAWYKRD